MYRNIMLFLLAAAVSFLFTPIAKKLAVKFGAMDIPKDERRIHKKPIPRMGGLAIYLSFTILSLISSHFNRQVLGMLIGGTIIVIMGIIDDIKSLRPIPKLLFQIAAAIVLILFGVSVKSITIPFVSENASAATGLLDIPITILWVVGITNAVNFSDGLDGLACGISLISALTLFGVAIMSGRYTAMLLTIILSGACLGFLPYNFNPASVFMGDTGAQFLGFMLSAISIQGAIKSAAAVVVAVPILAIGVPIYDTLFAMVRRKINNKPIMEADRGHLHHRLLDLGFNQRQVVGIMYFISLLLGMTSLMAMRLSNRNSYALLIVVCAVIIATGIEFGLFARKGKINSRGEKIE
jgi:UDP-GlcNAc:undecaprenyl-phosphate GlcNAc-1-phosphate transferase